MQRELWANSMAVGNRGLAVGGFWWAVVPAAPVRCAITCSLYSAVIAAYSWGRPPRYQLIAAVLKRAERGAKLPIALVLAQNTPVLRYFVFGTQVH